MKNWEKEIKLPAKDPEMEYGYIFKKGIDPVYCDKSTLLRKIENDEVIYVATPNHDTFILPGFDYETLVPLLKQRRKALLKSLVYPFIFLFLLGGLMFMKYDEEEWITATDRLYILAFSIFPLFNTIYEFIALKRINESNFQRETQKIKFAQWIDQKRNPFIYVVIGILVAITLVQFLVGMNHSIELSGLVKAETFEGQYWRLLTCTLMHVGFLHLVFNVGAIFALGQLLVAISSKYHFTLVFLVSALTGSLFSLFLTAETSVGASGGILGLIGFVFAMSFKLKSIPQNIFKAMVLAIIFIAATGLSAVGMIDNYAHAGGLVAGIVLGMLLIKRKEDLIPYKVSSQVRIGGIVSGVILLVGIGIMISRFVLWSI
jgi:rhomboid protease GluP